MKLNRPVVMLSLFCGMAAWYLLRWPIVMGDADVWFHLTAGRYTVEHHHLPMESFFSFVTPARPWVDYAWLFQVVVYGLHQGCGYPGLIVLRTGLYVAAVLAIALFLFTAPKADRSSMFPIVVALLYAFLLLPRYQLVRPHIFVYLFLILFLWLLESRSRWMICLPMLGWLWCNLHGITYPVMVFICCCYLIDGLLEQKPPRNERGEPSRLFLILLTAWTPFATPHGLRLITLPFLSAVSASRYIYELSPFSASSLASLSINALVPNLQTIFAVIFWILAWQVCSLARQRTLRLRHGLLVLGGLLGLWLRGERAIYECALFGLPLLRLWSPRRNPAKRARRLHTGAPLGFSLAVLLISWLWLRVTLGNPPRYPVSYRDLPEGVCAFLRQSGARGSVLNFPNTGGYLEWRLYPQYTIFIDMDVPFFFSDYDVFVSKHMYHDREVFRKVVARYAPEFVTVPITIHGFHQFIGAFPDYVPVFFDDAEVLYVDKRKYPAIAEQHRLTRLNPFLLAEQGPGTLLLAGDYQHILEEVWRLLRIYPEGLLANQLACVVLQADGQFGQALARAQVIVRHFPETPTGYGLQGDALAGLRQFGPAIASYHQALRRARGKVRTEALYQMGRAYLDMGRPGEAYALLKKAVDPFAPDLEAGQLLELGKAALMAGKREEAAVLLRLAAEGITVPQEGERTY